MLFDQNMAAYAHMNQSLAEETNGPASNKYSIQNLLGWHWVWGWAEVAWKEKMQEIIFTYCHCSIEMGPTHAPQSKPAVPKPATLLTHWLSRVAAQEEMEALPPCVLRSLKFGDEFNIIFRETSSRSKMGGFVPLLRHLLQWFQMGCTNMLLRKRRELCASTKE